MLVRIADALDRFVFGHEETVTITKPIVKRKAQVVDSRTGQPLGVITNTYSSPHKQ